MEKLTWKRFENYKYEQKNEVMGKKFEDMFEKVKIKMNKKKAETVLKQREDMIKQKEYLESLKLKDPDSLTKEESGKLADYLEIKPFIDLKTEVDITGELHVDDKVIKRTEEYPDNFIESLMNNDKLRSENYFAGKTDVIEEKFQAHLRFTDAMIERGFTDIQKNLDYRNYHEIEAIKKEAEQYKKISQSAEFYKLTNSYATTDDIMRIDCGLIISRPPIFLK